MRIPLIVRCWVWLGLLSWLVAGWNGRLFSQSESNDQVVVATDTNTDSLPARRLTSVHATGTVIIGGNTGGVVLLDGYSTFQMLPPPAPGQRWRRGQRVQIDGCTVVDGTNLFLEPHPLIENDGLHAMTERSAGLWLDAGMTPLRLDYFNRTGDRGLELYISGPGLTRKRIPTAMLYRPVTNALTGLAGWTNGLYFRLYTGDWTSLPDFKRMQPVTEGVVSNFDINLANQSEFYGLSFSGNLQIEKPGFYTFSCLSDDGSVLDIGSNHVSIKTIGITNLPELPQMAAGQLLTGNAPFFCATLEGVITFVLNSENGLQLELSSGRSQAVVRFHTTDIRDPQWLMGARVSVTGICKSVFTPEGYTSAGDMMAGSDEDLTVLDLPKRSWDSQPIMSLNRMEELGPTNPAALLIRVQGILATNKEGQICLQDGLGEVPLERPGLPNLRPGARVEVLGVFHPGQSQPAIRCYALRKVAAATGGAEKELPQLTTIGEVKQMSREEAKLGYPVKVRGVITFVWPDAGFFLQDATWSIDVRLATNAIHGMPQIGEYWEVEGNTMAAFAPDILATHARRLGQGILPDPVRPNWSELLDGSMDTQYIEVQGVILSVDGTIVNLLTDGGRIRASLPEISGDMLIKFRGALVRIRGCLIPGRDINTQQVKLGDFELRNASVAVDQPAPRDPFALPVKHATDLLMFDAHASQIQRTRLQGVVLQQRDNVAFLMDRSNGVRVVSEYAASLRSGDEIEAVGFPDLNGPSPVFDHALIRVVGHSSLPMPRELPPDKMVDGNYDSTLVEIQGMLISQRKSGTDQILEMRTGARPWLAQLLESSGTLPQFAPGSELRLTGVYDGQGSDRARGRDIDSFQLLLNAPADVVVVHQPSWWTVRRALAVVGALLTVLLLAAIWISALRRRVEERTRALKSEIEDHKQTELKLEEKTLMLTREIEERLRIEAEVERGHKQLLVTSRLAGMAEVATSVLHNVGNVMTSVNVLSTSIVELIRNSRVASVNRLGSLLKANRQDLGRFVAEDERGKKIPEYVEQLGSHLAEEQSLLLQKIKVLNENIQHINEIVAMQQDFAKVSGVLETLSPEEVVEDALRMHGESLKRHGIRLIRDYESPLPPVTIDRHKVLQILFNLFENAKYACTQIAGIDHEIKVMLKKTDADFLQLTVKDTGMGIPRENLARIFGQGFSTRKDGHGFGLHSSVLAAQDMGGTLIAHSSGPGKGAMFVLEIPLKPQVTMPTQK